MEDISVLVVDDSVLMRNLISKMVDSAPGMTTVAKAMNGQIALEKIPMYKPDMIILDLEMPVMTGLEFMKERKKRGIDIPVVILSSIAHSGAAVTMECLELGASDFLLKPSGSVSEDIHTVAVRLVQIIQSYGTAYVRQKGKKLSSTSINHTTLATKSEDIDVVAVAKSNVIKPLRESGTIELIVFGISTGGPNALREVFANISPDITQPIIVVQHMPAGFTGEFATSLNNICPLEVKEAEEGDILKNGRILIAPGNKHIMVEKKTLASIVHLTDEPPCNGHRPSADVLFESVTHTYQNNVLGIIMTGMGRDGAVQLAEMRRQGARTLGQDEESSVVYGMPRAAFELGAVERQVSLKDMANTINRLCLK